MIRAGVVTEERLPIVCDQKVSKESFTYKSLTAIQMNMSRYDICQLFPKCGLRCGKKCKNTKKVLFYIITLVSH